MDDRAGEVSGLRWDVGFGVYGPGPVSVGCPDLVGTMQRLRSRMLSGVAHWGASDLGYPAQHVGVSRFATGTFKQSSWNYKIAKFDERRWLESLDGFPERYDSVSLDTGHWELKLVCDVDEREVKAMAMASGSYWAERGWVPRLQASQMALVVCDLFDDLVAAAAVPGVQTGFVNFDASADPFGSLLTSEINLERFEHDRWVRGYYWALLLTGGHMERLGGAQRFARVAPCEDIVTVEQAGEPVWVCRLTTDPLELTAARMQEWRGVLEPVLPEIFLPLEHDGSRFWSESEIRIPAYLGMSARLCSGPSKPLVGGPQLEWSDRVRDPEEVTVFVHPGPSFDRDRDTSMVAAQVWVWALYGKASRLAMYDSVTGEENVARASIVGTSPLTWDSDDDYNEVLSFTVRFGPGETRPLLERLVQAVPGWDYAPEPADQPGLPPTVPTIDIAKITIT